jgi:hypothetical protein
LLDHHPELGTPVTDVVLPYDGVPGVRQNVAQGIADHRRAEVADVHLLGDVGLGVVDDNPLAVARPRGAELVDAGRQTARQQGQVDETWACNFKCAQVVHLGIGDQLLGDAPRRLPELLRQPQRKAGLEMPELRLGRRPQLRVDAQAESGDGGSGQPRGQNRNNGHERSLGKTRHWNRAEVFRQCVVVAGRSDRARSPGSSTCDQYALLLVR